MGKIGNKVILDRGVVWEKVWFWVCWVWGEFSGSCLYIVGRLSLEIKRDSGLGI